MEAITNKLEGFLTGITDIDRQFVEGIAPGSLVLIEGTHESGKSVLGQHFAHSALRSKKNAVAFYTTEHTVQSLIIQMESLSLHILDSFLADSLRIFPVRLPISPRDSLKSFHLLTRHISRLQSASIW